MKNIHIESGLFNNPKKITDQIFSLGSTFSNYVIISDDHVASLYSNCVRNELLNAGRKCELLTFPQGEHNKTRKTKELLEDKLLHLKVLSDSLLIAIGGGVTTDLTGFIAATYARGISLINIPTSLLAMIDASIGGKNGVNTPFGKNSIGSIWEPKKVLIDPETLKTLSIAHIKEGLVEIIKHAVISSPELFAYLETHSLKSLDMEKLIYENCRIKTELVKQSEEIKAKRNLLNFGHTIGHALEQVTDYLLSHGNAVAIGMLIESDMAVKLGIMEKSVFERIKNILLRYDIPLTINKEIALKSILEAIILDKKSLNHRARFVMVDKIGSCLECDQNYCMEVDETVIKASLEKNFKIVES